MNITINLGIIVQILTICTAIGAIYATLQQRRHIAVKEGERNAQIKALQDKVDAMETDQRDLEKKAHSTDVDLGKINEKIDTLTDMIREIKDRIDKIAPPTVREHKE